MSNDAINRLRFRRQYVLAPKEFDCPYMHVKREVKSGYLLYAHIDLPVSEYRSETLLLLLLGDIFDSKDPSKGNHAILEDLAVDGFDRFLERFSTYSGRYVLLYIREGQRLLFHDASAYRKVFYCTQEGKTWFGSHPYLLAQILGLSVTADRSKLAFYNSGDYIRLNNSNLGDTTRYDEVRQLMPNHYFDIDRNKTVRYWPNKEIIAQPYKQVAEKCAPMIRGFVEAIANRYDIMIPVTAGKDSRIIAAASKGIKDRVYYYVNKEDTLSKYHYDVFIPVRLYRKLKEEFHVVNIYGTIENNFRKVYLENNPFASEFYLPHIYKYYSDFSNTVNLPGNIASPTWGIDRLKEDDVNSYNLAELYGVTDYEYALRYYSEWLNNCHEICKKYNMNPISLFYWEERLANWGTQIQLDKDIANEDFNPFNSRLLVSEFYSVEYRYLKKPGYIFHKEIIRILWPELLDQPFNPMVNRAIIKILKESGIYKYLK